MIALAPLAVSWTLGALLLVLDGRKRWVALLGICGLLVVLGLDAALLSASMGRTQPLLVTTTGGWPPGIGIRLEVDRTALLFGITCAAVLSAAMIHEALVGIRSRLLPALLLLLSAGLHGAFFTGDLFDFYVFFELSMVVSFALAAYGYGRAELRGALTYVAVNLFGSALFIVGIASVYHALGTLDFVQIAQRAPSSDAEPLVLSTTLLFVALALKLGLFPFHGWVPALYGNARPGVAAVLAGALVNIGAYGLLHVAMLAVHAELVGRTVLVILGSAAILYGAILAWSPKNPAEVAAYASVVHAGYVVLALGVGGPQGLAALLLVVVAGSLDKAAMFIALDGRGRVRVASSVFAAASVGGLPPSFSFVAKLALLRAAVDARAPGIVIGVLVVGSAAALVAGVRFHRRAMRVDPPSRPSWAMAIVLAGLSSALCAWPAPVSELVASIAATTLPGGPP